MGKSLSFVSHFVRLELEASQVFSGCTSQLIETYRINGTKRKCLAAMGGGGIKTELSGHTES